MSPTRLVALLLALALGAAACTDTADDDDATSSPPTDLSRDDIRLTSALDTVDDCDALLDRLVAEGLERVGPYGFGRGGPFFAFEGDVAVEETEEMEADTAAGDGGARFSADDEAAAADAETTAQAGGDDDFSGTNNQEEGVDEADLVKTDGRRLVVATGNRLEVIDVTGSEPELVETVRLPEDMYGGELFLASDSALLMTSGWTAQPFLREAATDATWFPGSPTGRIVEVDLSTGEIGTTMEFEGSYLSAREVDGSIRIVLSAAETRFAFLHPSNPGAEDAAEEANRDLVAESTIDMWIPTYRVTDADGVVTEGPIVDCDRVHLPAEFAGFGSLVVLTVDLEGGLAVQDSLSVFTDAQTVYASPTNLSVATPRWPEWNEDGSIVEEEDDYRTAIHSFDISNPTSTSYTASGSVRGHLLNRFSMSEHDGYLRVATTDGSPWDSRGSESFVTVLSAEGGELVQVGQVGGLGRGEQIFAVRFLGDLGYVVTFEQIDPLYTIDLSDPTDPVMTGELKIPGFSSYLHPVGDHLIGIGTDGDDEGRTFGAVASLFDVADDENPTLVDKVALAPEAPGDLDWFDSQSPVAWDARAFTFWGETMLVPVTWWGHDEDGRLGDAQGARFVEFNGSAVALIRVDAEAGTLTPIGRVGHPQVSECSSGPIPVEAGVVVQTGGLGTLSATAPVPAEDDDEATDDGTDEPSGDPGDDESTDAEADFARSEDELVEEEPLTRVPDEEYCWTHQPEIRRSVVIGADLYTVSDSGVAVNRFDGLDTVTWIPWER